MSTMYPENLQVVTDYVCNFPRHHPCMAAAGVTGIGAAVASCGLGGALFAVGTATVDFLGAAATLVAGVGGCAVTLAATADCIQDSHVHTMEFVREQRSKRAAPATVVMDRDSTDNSGGSDDSNDHDGHDDHDDVSDFGDNPYASELEEFPDYLEKQHQNTTELAKTLNSEVEKAKDFLDSRART